MVFILLTILTWGLAQVLIKKGLSYLSPWQSYALDTILAFFLWVPYGLTQPHDLSNFNYITVFYMVTLGVNVGLNYYLLDKGPVSIIAPIIATYPVVTLILAHYFLGESMNHLAYFGVTLIITGIIFISLPEKTKGVKKIWLILSLVNSIGWGIESIGNKYLVDISGNGGYLIILWASQAISVLLWGIIKRDFRIAPKGNYRRIWPTLIGIFMWNTGTITYAKALENNQTSLVTPITNLYILVTVLSSTLFLREKIRLVQWIGIMGIILGLYVIQSPNHTISSNPISMTLKPDLEKVTYVYDGDTIKTSKGIHIRLIGIDAPEYQGGKQEFECYGKQSREMLEKLILNQDVSLEADLEDKDTYSRTLRYIWSENVFINEYMVRWGYAKVIAIKPNIRYYPLLKSAESEARQNKRGMWGRCH